MEPKNKMLFPLSHWVGIARQPACVWCVGIHKIIKSDFLYIKNPSILFAQDWAGENPVSLPGTVPLAFILLFFSYSFQELRNNIFVELRGFVWYVFSLFDAFDGWTNCPKISEVSWWAVCSCCRHEIGLFVAFSLRWSGARVLFLIRKKGENPSPFLGFFWCNPGSLHCLEQLDPGQVIIDVVQPTGLLENRFLR